MVDVPQSQARRIMQSSAALNVSDGIDSPDTNHHAIVEDSLNDDLFEICSDVQSMSAADERHHVPTKGKLKSTKNQPSLPVHDHEQQKASPTSGKLATAHGSLAALKGRHITTEEQDDGQVDEDMFSPSEDEPDGNEDVDEYQPPAKKVKLGPRSNQAHAKTKSAPARKSKSKPKPRSKQKANQRAKPQQPKTRKDAEVTAEAANANMDDSKRSKQNSMPSAPQAARRSAASHMSASSTKQKPKLPLVDEEISKKAAIIAFDEHGPLNQGRSSLPPSAFPETTGHGSLPVSATKRKKHSESMAVSMFTSISQEDGDSDPLGGYAKHMPDRAWKARSQRPDEPDATKIAAVIKAAVLESDHADAHGDDSAHLPDIMDMQQHEVEHTVSQLAMPPPARPTETIQVLSNAAAVAVMPLQGDTPASDASTEVPDEATSPGRPSTQRRTSAAEEAPTAMQQACADDSGYHSTVQPLVTVKRVSRARSVRSDLHVNDRGSPRIAPMQAVTKESAQAQPDESVPRSSEIFNKKTAGQKLAPPHDFAKSLSRDYGNVFPSEHTTMPSRDASSPPVNDQTMHEAAEDDRRDDIMDDISRWRGTLAEHHVAIFDSLLVDAYHVVSQVARRENLIQGRIDSYREKGQKLVKDLTQTYEREVSNLQGANMR